jgi:hypothetical protein
MLPRRLPEVKQSLSLQPMVAVFEELESGLLDAFSAMRVVRSM